MKNNIEEKVLLELLRVGLIAIQNLSETPSLRRLFCRRLQYWSTLCHSIPPILIGNCANAAIAYFLNGDANWFVNNYPKKNDADYIQIKGLLSELKIQNEDVLQPKLE